MLFTEYLNKKGVVSKPQALEAISQQEKRWMPIGKVALAKKLLTMKQVFDILNKQADVRKRFGELAVDLGYLTEKDVEMLLVAQREENQHVGEVLVSLGHLDKNVLREEIRSFLRFTDGKVVRGESSPSSSPGTTILLTEYLIKKKIVSSQQILEALNHQRVNRRPIGAIALAKRVLTMKQVFSILNRQSDVKKRFGEIAVELGYITEEGVDRLLLIQREENPHIGEVLVLVGHVKMDVLEKEELQFLRFAEAGQYRLLQMTSEASRAGGTAVAPVDDAVTVS